MSAARTKYSRGRIELLPPVLIDKIAAGEVIEGPFSVIKELVENAIDAGATRVQVHTRAGGIESIEVQDDGAGISRDELPLSIQRHATSKIQSLEDLEAVSTFGFRGEALAAIASVSHLTIRSGTSVDRAGALVEVRGGEQVRFEPIAACRGTTVAVRDLFYATPARRKYLRSERSENQRNLREIMRIALANPGVSFDYFREGKSHISVVAAEDLRTRICQLWPGKPGQHLVRVQAQSGGLQLSGFITDEHFYRANREGQYSFVNGRPVDVKHLSYLVRKAYGEILPPGAHPYYFLFLEVDRTRVDVNVHPAKQEVRLLDQPALHGLVLEAIHKALRPVTPLSMPGIAGEGGHSGPRFQHSLTAVEEVLLGAPLPLRAAVDINPSGSSPGAPESFSNREDQMAFLPDRHFGVFFGTYILAESADALFLIDQHTAHERINYEKQRRNLEGQAGKRQALLHPIAIDCLPDELEQVLNHEQALAESGFLVEAFGPRSYIVREVPPYLEPGAEEEAILHLIHRTLEGERGVRLYDEYAAMKACKGSIKRNDRVDDSVLSSIIRELSQCENPSRCPHGRPTMYRISRAELDRWFHRA